MSSDFPGSPKILKGGLVAYQLPDLLPTLIVFQYNPDEVSRDLRSRGGQGGGRGDANRTDGPPDETLTFTVEIDAADPLADPGKNPVVMQNGLHPVIAALEGLLYPAYATVIANEAMAMLGSGLILGEQAPLALLIWGPKRVLPVQVQSLSIKEQAFDGKLNPIRVSANLTLRVLTYRDLNITNPGYWVFMASFTQKEVMSGVNTMGDASALASLVPF
ncbi:MAG: hypothetical protein ACREE0_12245 [Phenylobacterium sp.]